MNSKPVNLWSVLLLTVALVATLLLLGKGYEPNPSTVGGTEVPVLHCEEDEVIGFDSTRPAPYPLDCIHIDAIGG